MTLVAVVIAAHNPGPFLAETLASLAEQTSPPAEVMVVDDGSDGSDGGDVADTVARFPGVRSVRQERLGAAVARNRGAAATSAAALLFLDADDLLRPRALERLGATLEDHPQAAYAYGRTREFPDARFPPAQGMRGADTEQSARLAGATLVRRTAWERVGPLDAGIARGEWIDWVSRAQTLGLHGCVLDEVVLDRRLHSFNRSQAPANHDEYLRVVRAALLRKRPAHDG